jgi:pyridinium-3,5-biscarboxylic acid mononucleotide sulfurtransferase
MNRQEKFEHLKTIISQMKRVIVAYSGGVDSTFLLKVAYDVLKDDAKGVLAISPSYPSREYEKALKIAEETGAKVEVIETNETENEKFLENPVDRCYFCKSELFNRIAEYAKNSSIVMVDGSNFDDLGDHRPGMKALKEMNIRSPLQEAELTKEDIRELSKSLGLKTWNKDALACLSSRFPYGERIDIEKLKMVDEAENFLTDLGFRNLRARHQGTTIKIEVAPEQLKEFFDDKKREMIVHKLKSIGYTYITVDLEGYRQGSMNEVISTKKKINTSGLKMA